MQLKPLLIIFLGGGIGASLRYVVSSLISLRTASAGAPAAITFPWGIFACNLLGCLLIGTAFGWINANHPSWLHPLLVTGILGGFTTFSSFALDTQLLLQNHAYLLAGLYAIGSLLLGITLCLIGYLLTS